MKIYGLDGDSSTWMESYMYGRSQRVFIDGELLDNLSVEVGVPQSSILGPVLYCLMVNELPKVAHSHPPDELQPYIGSSFR